MESTGPFQYRLQHCLPMAGTDAFWTLGLWAIVTGVIPRPDSTWRFAGLAALGAVSAAAVERVALANERWANNAPMPVLPVPDIGLWPVLQMTVVPAVSIWLSRQRSAGGRQTSGDWVPAMF